MASGRRHQNIKQGKKDNHFQIVPSTSRQTFTSSSSSNSSSKSSNSSSSSSSNSSTSTFDETTTKLIVNYLPQSMRQTELEALFTRIAPVEKCCIIKDRKTGDSLEFGFIHYKQSEDAEKARLTLNGLKLQNKTIRVSYARPRSEAIKGANLYVCGLPKNMTNQLLEAIFSPFGRIITYRILRDQISAKQYSKCSDQVLSTGVAFVRFDRRQEAERAVQALNGNVPEGCYDPIKVKYAKTPTHAYGKFPIFSYQVSKDGCPIFVYNLPPIIKEHVLWQLFGPFGAVQSINVNRGYAFITMVNRSEAQAAVQQLRGHILENRPMQIQF